VREALDLALDRQELIQRVFGGHTQPATQLVPPTIVGYDPTIEPTGVDRSRARLLLAEAGHPEGLEIRLDGPNNRYARDREMLDELSRQLALVGVSARPNALDKREFFPLIESAQSKLHLLGFSCESGDAGDLLDSLLHSQKNGMGVFNSMGVADPELDGLVEASNRAIHDVERSRHLRAAMARAAALRVALPLVIETEVVALARNVDWDPPLNLALRPEKMRRRD
jgi:peptide/nickel transport system substrate-binding protein